MPPTRLVYYRLFARWVGLHVKIPSILFAGPRPVRSMRRPSLAGLTILSTVFPTYSTSGAVWKSSRFSVPTRSA